MPIIARGRDGMCFVPESDAHGDFLVCAPMHDCTRSRSTCWVCRTHLTESASIESNDPLAEKISIMKADYEEQVPEKAEEHPDHISAQGA